MGSARPRSFMGKFYETFKEEIIPFLYKISISLSISFRR